MTKAARRARRPVRTPTRLADLRADPENARTHDERNLGLIRDSLQEVGAARSIVIDEANVVRAGNGVVAAATAAGLTKLQVVDVDGDTIVAVRRSNLTAEQKRRLALFDNRAGETSAWNLEVLRGLPAEATTGLWTAEELAALLAAGGPKLGRTDPDDIPQARPTDIRRGDLFTLGAHRLLCGDSTQALDVHRLLEDARPDVAITDPPYCSGGFQEAGRGSGSIGTRGSERIANDTLSTRGYIALMKAAIGLCPVKTIYVFTDWRMWINLFDVAESSGYGVRNMLVWDKGTPGMGIGWRMQHELILIGVKISTPFDPHKAEGNVLKAQRTGNLLHPTQKPVELIQKILDVTTWAQTVIDPFGGSGTTLLACEQCDRAAFGMELDPVFCQVAIDRWEAFTGKKAQKVGEAVRTAEPKRRRTSSKAAHA